MGQFLDDFFFSFCSIVCSCLSSDRNISGLTILRWVGGPIPQLGVVPIYWRCSLQVLSPLYCIFLLAIPIGSWESVTALESGIFSGNPQFPISHCHNSLFDFLTLCTSLLSLPIPVPAPFSVPLLYRSQVLPHLFLLWLFSSPFYVGFKPPQFGLPSSLALYCLCVVSSW